MKDAFFVHPQKLLFRPLSKSPYDRQVGGVHVALSWPLSIADGAQF